MIDDCCTRREGAQDEGGQDEVVYDSLQFSGVRSAAESIGAQSADPSIARVSHSLYVIVPAGGLGTRFGSKKQFVKLGGKALLLRTVEKIRESLGEGMVLPEVDSDGRRTEHRVELKGIVVAVPHEDLSLMNELLSPFHSLVSIAEGGKTRAESVKCAYHILRKVFFGVKSHRETDQRGLESPQTNAVEIKKGGLGAKSDFSDAFIAVHDGCRPFASTKLWEDLLGVLCGGADFALPYTPLTDTIKLKSNLRNVPREDLITVQTPQMMRIRVAEKIYHLEDADVSITDDATLAEKYGFSIALVRGEKGNLKITDPEDLELAEKWLK